jgi:integrase
MSLTKLPSGRWRAQVHITGRGNVAVGRLLPHGQSTFATKREAKAAREQARALIGADSRDRVTVAAWRDRWLTDPLFERPKRSTMIHNAERTRAFADRYGTLPLPAVDDQVVAEWLAGGRNRSTVMALRAMFADATKPAAGRLITVNPFANLGLRKPPARPWQLTEDLAQRLVTCARELTPPSFAAYLQFGGLTALRPSEIDALKLADIDLDAGLIQVRRRWSAKARDMDIPKYGTYTAVLVDDAKAVLLAVPRQQHDGPWAFCTLRGHHYTPSTRSHHWNRVRCAAGLGDVTLYQATRHYFAWYGLNVLSLPPHVLAEQLGHKDGGRLITSTYGHPDADVARERIREAFRGRGNVRQLPIRRDSSA